MRAMVLQDGCFSVEQVPEPEPVPGQMLARPLACGVCGSDLHAKDHASHLCDLLHRTGFRGFMDPSRPVVMGHEFCCEVIDDLGRDRRLAPGVRVVSMPFLQGPDGIELIGYSNRFNGAFADAMLLDSASAFAVPEHVATEIAALTEPFSVAVHAVAESGGGQDTAFAVVGCGPVGLLVIARLKSLGLGPVLAIEPTPSRRAMAERMGADVVLAPGDAAAGDWWTGLGLPQGLSDAMAQDPALRTRSKAVLFECVGKPGMLMALGQAAPVGATIVAVGTCMEPDRIEPAFLLQKALRVQFVFAYTARDFADAFADIVADTRRFEPLVTGRVGLADVDEAFRALTSGGDHIKMLVTPTLDG